MALEELLYQGKWTLCYMYEANENERKGEDLVRVECCCCCLCCLKPLGVLETPAGTKDCVMYEPNEKEKKSEDEDKERR